MLQAAITDFCLLVGSRNKMYGKILISLGLIYAWAFYLFISATNCNCPKLLCSSQDLLTTNMAAVEKVVSLASVSFQRTYTNMDKMYTQYRRKAPSVSISNRG